MLEDSLLSPSLMQLLSFIVFSSLSKWREKVLLCFLETVIALLFSSPGDWELGGFGSSCDILWSLNQYLRGWSSSGTCSSSSFFKRDSQHSLPTWPRLWFHTDAQVSVPPLVAGAIYLQSPSMMKTFRSVGADRHSWGAYCSDCSLEAPKLENLPTGKCLHLACLVPKPHSPAGTSCIGHYYGLTNKTCLLP